MEQIILYLQLFFVAALIVLIIYRIGGAFMNLLWRNEMEQLVRATLFRSFNWFRFALPIAILLSVAYPIQELLTGRGIFPFLGGTLLLAALTVAYLLFRRISSDPELYRYHKYNTSIDFYQALNPREKLMVYETMISRLKNSDFHNQALSQELQSAVDNDFIPLLDSILTFEWFDRELTSSKSNYTVGRLSVSNFRRDILSLLRAIQVKIAGNKNVGSDYSKLVSTLRKAQYLKFDDRKGVHYDETLVLDYIDEILTPSYPPEEPDTSVVAKSNKRVDRTIPPKQIILRNCTRKECIEIFTCHLKSTPSVKIKSENLKDIKKLFNDHFLEIDSRPYSKRTGNYLDDSFFGKNHMAIIRAFRHLANTHKEVAKIFIAEILVQDFPDHFPKVTSITPRLSEKS